MYHILCVDLGELVKVEPYPIHGSFLKFEYMKTDFI